MPGSRAVSRGHHALAIVEAAYSLEGSDSEWLRRVLDAASPDLERGLGSYAFTCRVAHGTIEMGSAYAERGLDPAFAKLVAELNRTVPPQFFEMIARSAVLSGGFAETVPQALQAHVRQVAASTGVFDAFALFAQDGEGYGINLSGPSTRAIAVPPRIRGLWNRVGVHLASAMRLRRRFASGALRDALLEPSGLVAHAEGSLRDDASALRNLATAVRSIERARTRRDRRDPEGALALWRGLVAGEWSLVDQWDADGRRYIAAYRNRPNVRDPRALTDHERVILHYATLGQSNKEIAFTLGLSSASVTSGVSQLLRKLGCRKRNELLSFGDLDGASEIRLAAGRDEISVLSVARSAADAASGALSDAERAIADLVIEGQTNAAIARARGTSRHTVANQIRSIFEKLGVGSRAALSRKLTRGA